MMGAVRGKEASYKRSYLCLQVVVQSSIVPAGRGFLRQMRRGSWLKLIQRASTAGSRLLDREKAHHPDIATGADLSVQLDEELLHTRALHCADQHDSCRPRHTSLSCPPSDPGLHAPSTAVNYLI